MDIEEARGIWFTDSNLTLLIPDEGYIFGIDREETPNVEMVEE